jgi:hypothetical protein
MRQPKKIVVKPMRYCSICGEMRDRYQIYQNAFLCESCVPTLKEEKKKVPSENQMLTTILEKKDEK